MYGGAESPNFAALLILAPWFVCPMPVCVMLNAKEDLFRFVCVGGCCFYDLGFVLTSGLVNGTAAVNTSRMRYSMLPRENLCTENLTPWKKLLPCYDRAGLAKLLNAIKLLSAHYFSIGFDATTVCGDAACAERFLHLQVSATAVVESGSIQDTGKFGKNLSRRIPPTSERFCRMVLVCEAFVNG